MAGTQASTIIPADRHKARDQPSPCASTKSTPGACDPLELPSTACIGQKNLDASRRPHSPCSPA
ncbi:predicted protein [Plenodomus lingam JN3]|uniref:Predicted protein n=1 Tax=Leptosphaeria maculans (strain JN3 / isolate v23.1.3 / race Av1-4-5-6-7-8) TaxID=985895 RepID=E5AB15_LEPMJ|nr:predicted protein [Plenodomus lingam JN3]CBY00856.1 predicted protein [Plenodomus lingam JN3]